MGREKKPHSIPRIKKEKIYNSDIAELTNISSIQNDISYSVKENKALRNDQSHSCSSR